MNTNLSHPVIQDITRHLNSLTPKGRILGNYIIQNPRKAVFMTTKELAEACRVSEATVVRFVGKLGYTGYGDFLQALRDFVDTGLSLPDRVDLPGMKGAGTDPLHRVLLEEINNLRHLYESADREAIALFVERLAASPSVYVIGSRVSYTFAYYLGWSLTKVRKGVHILKGSDSTVIDCLSNAPEGALTVIIATSRYPNELIKLARVSRRLHQTLLVITDSKLCPLIQFADRTIIAPSRSIPLIGYPAAISSIINCLILELASRQDAAMKHHQERLEQAYLENDILFNPHTHDPRG
ncbi:MurR/RpiR family transcriptional regulator [Desulfococcus sp.]|uniref:MurR/RpiR family transcriptional regulator n=1 Tax=Desulfococcus sp. TaxID=2025834 RepID=UPI0035930F9D